MSEHFVMRCPYCRLEIRGGAKRSLTRLGDKRRIYHQGCFNILTRCVPDVPESLTPSKSTP